MAMEVTQDTTSHTKRQSSGIHTLMPDRSWREKTLLPVPRQSNRGSLQDAIYAALRKGVSEQVDMSLSKPLSEPRITRESRPLLLLQSSGASCQPVIAGKVGHALPIRRSPEAEGASMAAGQAAASIQVAAEESTDWCCVCGQYNHGGDSCSKCSLIFHDRPCKSFS